jgi:hypothetical protein
MEALSLILSVKLAADEMRHSVGGDDDVRRTAEAPQLRRREHRRWNAFRRTIVTLTRRRPARTKPVVDRPCAVPQSSSD